MSQHGDVPRDMGRLWLWLERLAEANWARARLEELAREGLAPQYVSLLVNREMLRRRDWVRRTRIERARRLIRAWEWEDARRAQEG